jgi:hypothetical protein
MGTSINQYIPYPLDLQKAAVATGNGTEMELNAKYGTLVVRVLGITSATVTFEAMRTNVVGDAYAAITGTNIDTGALTSTATANGTFIFDVRGVWKFRARLGTYVSGTIYVHATATAQDGSGSKGVVVAFAAGNPSVTDKDCTLANTNYDVDVNTALGRNGHYGFAKSKSTNTGVVSMAISSDGTTFTSFVADIQPGDVISLDGMDIDTVRVKSTVAGDDVIVEVH